MIPKYDKTLGIMLARVGARRCDAGAGAGGMVENKGSAAEALNMNSGIPRHLYRPTLVTSGKEFGFVSKPDRLYISRKKLRPS